MQTLITARFRNAAAVALLLVAPTLSVASEEEIRAASAAWDDLYNGMDLERLMDRYHEDAVSMVPGAPASVGRDAIRRDFESFLAGHDAVHRTEIQEIRVEGDLAVERANYSLAIAPKDGAPIDETGKHIVVYSRGEDGVWRVLWEIWNEGQ